MYSMWEKKGEEQFHVVPLYSFRRSWRHSLDILQSAGYIFDGHQYILPILSPMDTWLDGTKGAYQVKNKTKHNSL